LTSMITEAAMTERSVVIVAMRRRFRMMKAGVKVE
jgi:hypothetical protein